MKKISYENIKKNVTNIKNYANKSFFAVLKNNAYNCGLESICNSLNEIGHYYIMLTEIEDAIKVKKKYQNMKILLANPLITEELQEIAEYQFHIIIDNFESLKNNYSLMQNHIIHLQINSSMNRFGINSISEINKIIDFCTNNNLQIEGIATHFSLEDEDIDLYNYHVKIFRDAYSLVSKTFNLKYIHAENSYTYLKKDSNLDFCNYARIGLLLYGYNTSQYDIKLYPLISFNAKVKKIRELKKDDTFSYGKDNTITNNSLVAICDAGYGDGLLRDRNELPVLINNKKYNIIGKISMSHMYIKVDQNVKIGDTVIIYNDKDLLLSDHAKIVQLPTSQIMSYLN